MFAISHRLRLLITTLLTSGLAGGTMAAEPASTEWPERVVGIEVLRPLTRFSLRVPGIVVKGRVTGPAILRAHVTTTGTVARVALYESSGNSDLDEAALHGMRDMRFKPYTFGSIPTEVTLVVPIHVPKQLGRSD